MAVRKIISSTIAWGGTSVALSATLPHYLSSIIHFPTTCSTAFVLTSIFILTPTGFLRGCANSVEDLAVPAAGNAVIKHLKRHDLHTVEFFESGAQSLRQGAHSFDLSSSLLSSTGSGVMIRALLGLFLPSTEVLLEHLAAETKTPTTTISTSTTATTATTATVNTGEEFLQLARGTTNGLIAGQIVVFRDRFTMLGLLIAMGAVAATIGADQAAHAGVESKMSDGMNKVKKGAIERLESSSSWFKKKKKKVEEGDNE